MLLLRIETPLVLFGYLSNIQLTEIPKENIFKGAYKRPEKYVPRNITRKVKKINYL
jgi:hypothetical protein